MKIILILASSGPTVGGMELQAVQQAEELSKIHDTEVSIISAACFDTIISKNVTHFPEKMNRSRRNPLLLINLLSHINKFSPDIIHAHGHKAASLVSTLKPLLNRNIKLIATAHNVKRNNKPLLKMDRIFVVSQGIAKAISPLNSHVVLNGIKSHAEGALSKQRFCNELGIDPSLPLILGVGRLVPTKRFEYLLQAAEGLKANVVICGDRPEFQKLQKLAPSNCLLLGHRKDIRDILFTADCMVIIADRDGFSLALIEALHSGLPVLSTAVPGAQDLLPETCLIRDTEKNALHSFLKKHLDHIDKLIHIQQSQIEFVRNELHISQVAQRTHALYKEFIEKK